MFEDDTMMRADPLAQGPIMPPMAPPPVMPSEQNNAARRLKRQRLLYALAQGLGQPPQPGGGFMGGLTQGFSGALGGSLQAQRMQHEDEKERVSQEAAAAQQQRQYERDITRDAHDFDRLTLDRRRVDMEQRRLDQPPKPEREFSPKPWYEAPDVDPRLRSLYRTDATRAPQDHSQRLVQVAGPDGSTMWVSQEEAKGKTARTRAQGAVLGEERTALAFYNRAKDAENTIGPLEDKMAKADLGQQFRLRFAPNVMQSSDQQVYRQSQRTFTEARLREESGAAIPKEEYENDSRTYFAQPGDSPETIRTKRARRQKVLDGMKFQSGRAYNEYYGEQSGKAEGAADLIYNPATGELEPPK